MNWIEENTNKILLGDCLELMKEIPDKSIDITITSPPYNFNKGSGMGTKYKNGYKDNLSYNEYFHWQRKCIKEMIRVSNLVFYNIQFIAGNSQALLMLLGYFHKHIKEIIIWDKIFSEPAINEGVLNSEFEFIIVFEKNTNGRKFNNVFFDRGTLDNVFRINKLHNWKSRKNNDWQEQRTNLATFPIALPEMIIKNFSKENQIIMDPFAGLSTTAIACHNLRRNFICIEKDPEYHRKSVERYEKHILQERIF